MSLDNTNYQFHDHPRAAVRFVVLATIVVLVFALAVAFPGRSATPPGPLRDVADDCESPWCVSTRQLVTREEAMQMKRYLGDRALLVDIRAAAETPAGLALGSDVQVPFMEPVVASIPGKVADSQMEFRIDFAPNVDEALRAAHMRHGQPVILMSPSTERAVLAALLLQERGYTKIYVTRE